MTLQADKHRFNNYKLYKSDVEGGGQGRQRLRRGAHRNQ